MKVLKLELAQEHIELIKQIIKSDRKFQNNEDLFDDFFNETCKRALSVIETIDDKNALESYLRKIVSTSIILVLKDLGRVRRTQSNYVSTENINVDSLPEDAKGYHKSFNNVIINYDFIDLNPDPEEIVVQKELLQNVQDSIIRIHKNDTSKQYLQLYSLRYIEGKKQSEIAKEMNLSQSEVSKRLYNLMETVRADFV